MTDRRGPWITIAWSIGIAILAAALLATWHTARATQPNRHPIPSPTAPR